MNSCHLLVLIISIGYVWNSHRLLIMIFRESEGEFQYGNYRREADDLRAVISYLSEQKHEIAAIIGHSKGRRFFSFVTQTLSDTLIAPLYMYFEPSLTKCFSRRKCGAPICFDVS